MKKFAETLKTISDIFTSATNVIGGLVCLIIVVWTTSQVINEAREQD